MRMQRAGDWDSDCGPASAATVAPRYYPLCRYFIFHLCDKQVAKILLEKGIHARSSRVFHASRSLRSGVSRKLPRRLLRRPMRCACGPRAPHRAVRARPAARLRRLLRRPLPREVLAELHKSLPRVGRLPHWAGLCAEQPVARPFVRIQVPQPAYSHPGDSERNEGGASHATARPAPVLMRQREPDVWLRLSQASARRCGGSKRGRVSARRCGLWTRSPYTGPAPARWGGRRASPAPRRGSRRHSARSRTRGRCEARSSSYVG